jgi:hypothetical protein
MQGKNPTLQNAKLPQRRNDQNITNCWEYREKQVGSANLPSKLRKFIGYASLLKRQEPPRQPVLFGL